MIDYNAIEEKIFDYIQLAAGLGDDQIRRSYQNASAQPTQDRQVLVSYNIINQIVVGTDSRKYADDDATDLEETMYGDRNITVSVQAYGDAAQNTIETVSLFTRSFASTEFLNKNSMGFLRKGQVLDISNIQNGSFENRRQLDLEFHIVVDNTETVNAVESAQIGLAYYGSDTITETIEVINNES
jgi:hypothetical protein